MLGIDYKKPTQILVRVMGSVVAKIWEDEKASLGPTATKNPLLARIGFNYLEALEREKARSSHRGYVRPLRNEASTHQSSTPNKLISEITEFVATVGGVVLIGILGLALLYILYEFLTADWAAILSELYREVIAWVGEVGIRGILGLLAPLFFMLLPLFIAPLLTKLFDPELVYAEVYPSYWRDRATELLRSDRTILWSMINSDDEGSSEIVQAVNEDTDLNLPPKELPPALPPGVTEIALANSKSGVDRIREGLQDVRRNHMWLTRVFSAGFAASMAVAISGLVFLDFDPKLILGSGGFSAVAGAFTFIAMRNLRMANLALALFESYVAELADRLEMIPSSNSEEASMEMQRAWRDFRMGVNDLHRLEQISLLPKSRSNDEGSSGEEGD